jgi:uncharacterized integral membrane protein
MSMELEEMKSTWQQMSDKLRDQEILNKQLIERMTQESYQSRMQKIGTSEYIGTVICYIGAAYVIINFATIERPAVQVLAVVLVLLLFVLPILSLKSVAAMRGVRISSTSYVEAIEDFAKRRIRFERLQKINVSFGLFVLLFIIPVFAAIQGKDVTQTAHFWTLIFPMAVAFFLAFSYWVLKSYGRILNHTEKLLSDIRS